MKIEDYIRVNVPAIIESWYENAKGNYNHILSVTEDSDKWTEGEKVALAKTYLMYDAMLLLAAGVRVKDEYPMRISYGRFYESLSSQLMDVIGMTAKDAKGANPLADKVWQSVDLQALDLFAYWLKKYTSSKETIKRVTGSPVLNIALNSTASVVFSKNYELLSSISKRLL